MSHLFTVLTSHLTVMQKIYQKKYCEIMGYPVFTRTEKINVGSKQRKEIGMMQ